MAVNPQRSSKVGGTTASSRTCPECGGANLIWDEDRGEILCVDCGLVVSEETAGGEKAIGESISGNAPQGEAGFPAFPHAGRDAHGRPLSSAVRESVARWQRWQNRRPSRERSLMDAARKIARLSDKLKLSTAVRKEAVAIYRGAVERKVARKSNAHLAAAAVLAACKLLAVPKTFKEVAAAVKISEKSLSHQYNVLLRRTELHVPPSDPARFIAKVASKVNVSQRSQQCALTILSEVKRQRTFFGHDPLAAAGGAIYYACLANGEKISQRELAIAADISESSLRSNYRKLRELVPIPMPTEAEAKPVVG